MSDTLRRLLRLVPLVAANPGMAVDDAPGRAPATAGRGETAAADTGTHPSIKIASAIPAMARI